MTNSSISVAPHTSAPAEIVHQQPAGQDQRNLIQAVRAVNPTDLFGHDSEFTFLLDRATRKVVVRILSRQTGELIQQIPAEQVLRMAEEIKGR